MAECKDCIALRIKQAKELAACAKAENLRKEAWKRREQRLEAVVGQEQSRRMKAESAGPEVQQALGRYKAACEALKNDHERSEHRRRKAQKEAETFGLAMEEAEAAFSKTDVPVPAEGFRKAPERLAGCISMLAREMKEAKLELAVARGVKTQAAAVG